MNERGLQTFRPLMVLLGFSFAVVTIFSGHLKRMASDGGFYVSGKLVTMGQEEPAPPENIQGKPLLEMTFRLVEDEADEVFLDIEEKPPLWNLEVTFRGERFLNEPKMEGTTRQLLTYLLRGLRTKLPVYATCWKEDGEGTVTLHVWKNGAVGLLKKSAGTFYVF